MDNTEDFDFDQETYLNDDFREECDHNFEDYLEEYGYVNSELEEDREEY